MAEPPGVTCPGLWRRRAQERKQAQRRRNPSHTEPTVAALVPAAQRRRRRRRRSPPPLRADPPPRFPETGASTRRSGAATPWSSPPRPEHRPTDRSHDLPVGPLVLHQLLPLLPRTDGHDYSGDMVYGKQHLCIYVYIGASKGALMCSGIEQCALIS